MKASFFKDIKIILAAWFLLAIFVGVSAGLQSFPPKTEAFDNEAYNEYGRSIAFHQDLNLYREGVQFVTPTRNKPDFHGWGSGIFLAPFNLFAGILERWPHSQIECFLGQTDIALSLSNGIFLLLFAYFTLEIFKKIHIHIRSVEFFVFFASTPLVYYALLESSSNLIFFLAYLSFALNLLLECAIEKKIGFKFFLLGASFGFLEVVNEVGFFYWLGLSICIYHIFTDRKKRNLAVFQYLLGGISALGLNLINLKLRFGEILTPLFFIREDFMGFLPSRFKMISSLLGPRGTLYLSPVFILSIWGLLFFFEKKQSPDENENFLKTLFITLAGIFLLSFFVTVRYWYPSDEVIGKNFVEHQILFLFGFIIFIKRTSILKRILIYCFMIWNLIWVFNFFALKYKAGLFYQIPTFDFFLTTYGYFASSLIGLKAFPKLLLNFTPWVFFIGVLFFAFRKIFVFKKFWQLNNMILGAFVAITFSNLIFNSINSKDITSVPVIADPKLFVAEDWLKELLRNQAAAQVYQKQEELDLIEAKVSEIDISLRKNIPHFTMERTPKDCH